MPISDTSDRGHRKPVAQCSVCKHLIRWPYCFAFMTGEGIPAEIRSGAHNHTARFPGDGGITFTALDGLFELTEEALKRVLLPLAGQKILAGLVDPPSARGGPAVQEGESGISHESAQLQEELVSAAELGDAETVRRILALGVDINAPDAGGSTPLIAACRACQPEMVSLLLEKGADVNAQDKFARTALSIALQWGYPSIAETLELYGAEE